MANQFGIQIMRICLIIKWFTIQMPCTMVVHYSDHHSVLNSDKRKFVTSIEINIFLTLRHSNFLLQWRPPTLSRCRSTTSFISPLSTHKRRTTTQARQWSLSSTSPIRYIYHNLNTFLIAIARRKARGEIHYLIEFYLRLSLLK